MQEALQTAEEVVKERDCSAAQESARRQELEAQLERLEGVVRQLEQVVVDAETEKRRVQDALQTAEVAAKERDNITEKRASELECLTSQLEEVASAVERERTSSAGLRAELEEQRLQLTAQVGELFWVVLYVWLFAVRDVVPVRL